MMHPHGDRGVIHPGAVGVHIALAGAAVIMCRQRSALSLNWYIDRIAVLSIKGYYDREGFAGCNGSRGGERDRMVSGMWDCPISGTLWDQSTTVRVRACGLSVYLDLVGLIVTGSIKSGGFQSAGSVCAVCKDIGKGDIGGILIEITPAKSIVLEIGVVLLGGFCLESRDLTERGIIIGEPVIAIHAVGVLLAIAVGDQPRTGCRGTSGISIKAVIPSHDGDAVVGIVRGIAVLVSGCRDRIMVHVGGVKVDRDIYGSVFHHSLLDAGDVRRVIKTHVL